MTTDLIKYSSSQYKDIIKKIEKVIYSQEELFLNNYGLKE